MTTTPTDTSTAPRATIHTTATTNTSEPLILPGIIVGGIILAALMLGTVLAIHTISTIATWALHHPGIAAALTATATTGGLAYRAHRRTR